MAVLNDALSFRLHDLHENVVSELAVLFPPFLVLFRSIYILPPWHTVSPVCQSYGSIPLLPAMLLQYRISEVGIRLRVSTNDRVKVMMYIVLLLHLLLSHIAQSIVDRLSVRE